MEKLNNDELLKVTGGASGGTQCENIPSPTTCMNTPGCAWKSVACIKATTRAAIID